MDSLASLLAPVIKGKRRVVACHSATLSGRYPPNSLAAVEECVAAEAPRLEIDVRFMADDSMVIFHDDHLDADATGSGSVATLRRDALAAVRYRSNEEHSLCFLEDVVERIHGSATLLQVDLKLTRPITKARATGLAEVLWPVRDQVLVGSQAHWNLRRLTELPVAFDPTLQFHYNPGRKGEGIPRGAGAHGLWDDAPYASNPYFSAKEYLAVRLEDAWQLLPQAREWMVDIATIGHAASLGIEIGTWLAERGCELAAWTFREDMPARQEAVERMVMSGTTTFITDCPELLAADLAE